MSKLVNIDSNSTTYGDMVAEVLPRGPIWDPSNPGVGGMAGGLGVEAVRFHRRLYDLMLEAHPSTADELLAEWEEVFGLPLCTEPDTDDGRRLALAGRVAAQGGQSRAYYIDLAWRVLEADGELVRADDPNGVWIEERPYGDPFRAWGGSAWDVLGDRGSPFYWAMHLPSTVGAEKRHIIECLLCKYKPAHTVLLRRRPRHYYSTLGGASDYASASTNVAARLIFPGGGIGTFTVLMWVKQQTANGLNLWSCGAYLGDWIYSIAAGRAEQDVSVTDGGVPSADAYALLPDSDAWALYAVTCDGSTVRAYGDGVESSSDVVAGNYAAADAFVLFSIGADSAASGVPPGEEGSLSNIAIFDRALTAAEIAALYDAGESHDYQRPYGADWGGELPPVYWCTEPIDGAVLNVGSGGVCALNLNGDVASTAAEAAGYFDEITCETLGEAPSVTAYYSSPGAAGDYAEATGFDVLFTGSGVTAGAVAFWVRAAVGADASTVTLFEASDDGSPSLRATYGGSELAAQITDDTNTLIAEDILNGNTDGEWHHILVAPRADPTLVGDDIVPTADGVIIYIDGTNPTDGNVDSGTYATATSVLRLFARHDGSDRLAGDIANFAVFSSCPDITELPDLVAAGVRHDVRNPTGEWAGYHPVVYYRTAASGGVVANSGTDTGTSGLTLYGNVTSEAF